MEAGVNVDGSHDIFGGILLEGGNQQISAGPLLLDPLRLPSRGRRARGPLGYLIQDIGSPLGVQIENTVELQAVGVFEATQRGRVLLVFRVQPNSQGIETVRDSFHRTNSINHLCQRDGLLPPTEN